MGEKERLINELLYEEFNKYDWQEEKFIIREEARFVVVTFENVKFRFFYNSGYDSLSCDFSPNNEYAHVSAELGELVDNRIINYTEQVYEDQSNITIEEYINQFVFIIKNYLLDIIKGNFEIFDRVINIRENINFIQQELGKDLIFETEVYKRMINGDIDWKSELP